MSKPRHEIAKMFSDGLKGRFFFDVETRSYWARDDDEKVWSMCDPQSLMRDISHFVQSVDKDNRSITSAMKEDVMKQLYDYCEREPFVVETHLSFDDVQLDLRTLEPVEYDPANIALVRLHFPYESLSSTPSPLFDKYLADTCRSSDGTPRPLMVSQLQEVLGFALSSPEYDKIEKMVWLLGSGSNGKSPFIDLAQAVVGRSRFMASSLDDLMQPFGLVDVIGKKLICNSDEESSRVQLGVLKKIVSQEYFTKRRLFQSAITFRCRCRVLCSSNKLTMLDGMDKAVKRRSFTIPFDYEIKEENYDIDLAKKIIRNELPAVVAWALEGLKRLRRNNRVFTKTAESEEALIELENANNSSLDYLREFYERRDDVKVNPVLLFNGYKKWCENEANRKPKSRTNFLMDCKVLYGGNFKASIGGKSVRAYNACLIDTPTKENCGNCLLKDCDIHYEPRK